MEKVCVANNLIGVDQKILDWLAKAIFLGNTESADELDIKLWFGDVGLALVNPFGSFFFF